MDPDKQQEDEEWQSKVPNWSLWGPNLACRIRNLLDEVGQGSLTSRPSSWVKFALGSAEAPQFLETARQLVNDANDFKCAVDDFCRPVDNGWCGRTRWQSSYLWCEGLTVAKLAELACRLTRHAVRETRLSVRVAHELRREFANGQRECRRMHRYVMDPEKIEIQYWRYLGM